MLALLREAEDRMHPLLALNCENGFSAPELDDHFSGTITNNTTSSVKYTQEDLLAIRRFMSAVKQVWLSYGENLDLNYLKLYENYRSWFGGFYIMLDGKTVSDPDAAQMWLRLPMRPVDIIVSIILAHWGLLPHDEMAKMSVFIDRIQLSRV